MLQTRPDTSAPVHKPSNVEGDQRIPTRRDFQALVDANINDNAIDFFPEERPNTATLIGQKYRNPWEGNDQKRILALGFTLNQILVPDGANFDLPSLLNQLRHAAVISQRGTRKEEVLDHHLGSFLEFDRSLLHHETYDNGTNNGSRTVFQLKTLPMKKLADTSFRNTLFDSEDIFSLRVRFDATSAVPSSGNYELDDLELGGFVQLARNARTRQGRRVAA